MQLFLSTTEIALSTEPSIPIVTHFGNETKKRTTMLQISHLLEYKINPKTIATYISNVICELLHKNKIY